MSSENDEEWHIVSRKTKKNSSSKISVHAQRGELESTQNISRDKINACSVKLIPYVKYDTKINLSKRNKLCILLGLDAKYKELTPLGGTCIDRIPCNVIPTEKLKACLSRELDEESKGLLNLDNILDFKNCKSMSNFNDLEWGRIYHLTYFTELKLHSDNLHILLDKFQDPIFNKELSNKLILQNKSRKNYFEMSQLVLVTLDDDHFYNMIYLTIQHAQLFKEETMKLDHKLSDSIDRTLKYFYKEHPFDVKKYNPNITRLDPRLLCWIVQSLQQKYHKIYNSINDLIDNFIDFLKSEPTCHYEM